MSAEKFVLTDLAAEHLSQQSPQGKQSKAKMQDVVMGFYVVHFRLSGSKHQEFETKLHLPAQSSSFSCVCLASAKGKCGSAKL